PDLRVHQISDSGRAYCHPGQPRRHADRSPGNRPPAAVRCAVAAQPAKRRRMSSGALANGDLILAACLLAINGALSLAFGLRLELGLAIAAVRTAVQLAVIGIVLKFVFAQSSPLWTAGVALLLFSVAGYELLQRQQRR